MAQRFKAKTLLSNSGVFNNEVIAPNLTYSTGNQIISGIKTFATGIVTSGNIQVSGTGIFNALDLNNIDNLNLSGIDITITGSSLVTIYSPIYISGNPITTGNISYFASSANLITSGNTLQANMNTTGNNLQAQINNLGITYATTTNLSTTGNTLQANMNTSGNTLQVQINNLGSTYATTTNLSTTGNTLQANMNVSGNNLQAQINNLGTTYATVTNLSTTGNTLENRVLTLSGNCVLLNGNQTISGTKYFRGVHLISGDTNITGNVNISGHIAAVSKAFLIDHPLDSNKKLQYGSLEGPENGVYVRGKTNQEIINLPNYWRALVDEASISVNLTPIETHQNLYVIKYDNTQVIVGGNNNKDYFYIIYGERKDIPKLTVEF